MVISNPDSGTEWFSKTRALMARHPYWTLTVIVLAALGPFLAKPFNIDEPLFIWTAQQIQVHPGNPYGFNINWYGVAMPMSVVTKNPPLACYYLALAAKIFGWNETGLHAAFLLPALAVILGTYRLARRLCQWPLLAALVTLATPVFMISATTVMCDVMMLAFWVWAVAFWLEGMEQNHFWKLTAAGLLIGLAAITKYYGASLIPLLAACSLIEKRRPGWWIIRLLIPLAMLFVYQLATVLLYGHPLFASATDYALSAKGHYGLSRMAVAVIGLTFTGGCLAVVVFFAPLFWSRKALALFACGAIPAAGLLVAGSALFKNFSSLQGAVGWFEWLQVVFWAACGAGVMALAFADVLCRREARSWLLAMWMAGTFFFAAFLNWTVNARSLLPMAPAVGILLARRLEQNILLRRAPRFPGIAVCLASSAALAWWLALADYRMSVAVRESAREVVTKCKVADAPLWFQGHWGFQYYMEALGASAFDFKASVPKVGDLIAIPANNTNLLLPAPGRSALLGTVIIQGPRVLTTWNDTLGAGFYASAWGPLPFAFGAVPPERVSVYALGTAPSTPPQ
jgi:4-amino-4-deoxy-L-arabinose transferase-like glycosyltransferase